MALIKRILLCLLFILLPQLAVLAQNDFVVRHIRVQGLQRIDFGTVLHYLPIKQGQVLQPGDTSAIVAALYRTGFFTNVSLARRDDTLIINVTERPTIGAIKITGNKKIQTKQLQQVLKNIGVQEGNTYDTATLQELRQSLQHEYYSLGMFNATVATSVTPQTRNRVAINISINEGKPAKIKEIKFIGNHAFSEMRLRRQFKETTWRPWTFLTHSDEYSEEKLNTDLQALQAFYLDHGYLRFKVNSFSPNLSPNNKTAHIVVNITEGPVYHIKGFAVAGNLLGQQDTVRKAIPLERGEVFSRQKILDIDKAITRYYGDQGYAFAQVTPVPSIDAVNHQVFITFQVNPGRRVYVRQINFVGNTKTQDIVLRREMRQNEGGLYTLSGLEEGKRRLMMLGYLQKAEYQTQPVSGHSDQVDVTYNVQEQSSATASVQVGYSDMMGLLYGANITESNLLGTGKQVSLGFQNSQYSDNYTFTYINPYYTESGISRAISLYYQHVTPGNWNITPYTNNTFGGAVNYSLPISEYSYLSFGGGYEHINIHLNVTPSAQLAGFKQKHGDIFDDILLNAGWTRTTYDRAILPTKGTKQMLNGEVGLPVFNDSIEYYKLNYAAAWYQPLVKGFILHMSGDLGYGNGYGAYYSGYGQVVEGVPFFVHSGLPFFKNYYAGGIDSVRGYEGNTLGPLDSQGNPMGGNVLTTGTVGLIIPNPISDRLRLTVFADAGNVYDNQLALHKLRYSAGLGVEFWIPMVGPLEFAIAQPLNVQKTCIQNGMCFKDQSEHFEFSVGTSF